MGDLLLLPRREAVAGIRLTGPSGRREGSMGPSLGPSSNQAAVQESVAFLALRPESVSRGSL